jgi:hypothetical protein
MTDTDLSEDEIAANSLASSTVVNADPVSAVMLDDGTPSDELREGRPRARRLTLASSTTLHEPIEVETATAPVGGLSGPLAGAGDVVESKMRGAERKASASEPKASKSRKVKAEAVPEPEIDTDIVDAAVELIRDLTGRGLVNEIRRGEALEQLYRGARSDKNFARVLKEHKLGIGERQARNLRSVSLRFGAVADQWAKVGATHTHLRFLVDAPDGVVDQLFDEMKSGTKLTAADVQRRVAEASGGRAEPRPIDDVGGLRGLRSMAHRAADDNVRDFLDHIAEILAVVEEKLGTRADGSPKIVKEHTAKAAAWSTRCALKIFEQTFTGFWPEQYFDGMHSYRRFTAVGDRMHCLRRVLQRLDRPPNWPMNAALWIRDEVIPLLRWALGQIAADEVPFETIIEQGKTHWYGGDLPPTDYEREAGERDYKRIGREMTETPQAA